jgi:hypothetical protein
VGKGGSRTVAERRPGEELYAGGRRGSRGAEGVQRKKKRGIRPEGLVWNFQKVRGPLSKLKILTDIEVK